MKTYRSKVKIILLEERKRVLMSLEKGKLRNEVEYIYLYITNKKKESKAKTNITKEKTMRNRKKKTKDCTTIKTTFMNLKTLKSIEFYHPYHSKFFYHQQLIKL